MYKQGRLIHNLTENEKRFRDIILSTSDWFWETDEQGRYIFVSGRIKEILGYSEEELIGKTPFDFMDKDEAKKITEIFEKSIEKKETIKNLENWNIHKKGYKVLLSTNGIPILDNNQKLIGYRGVDKDITEQKKLEKKLKSVEIKLESMLIYSPYFIVTVDISGIIIDINHSVSKLTLEEVIGTSVYNYIPKNQEKIYDKYLKKCFQFRKVINTEFKDEVENRIYSIRFIPIKDDHKVNYIMIVANDITEKKKCQEENKELRRRIKELEN